VPTESTEEQNDVRIHDAVLAWVGGIEALWIDE